MIWLLLLSSVGAFAQVDLTAVQRLDEKLPDYNEQASFAEDLEIQRQNRRFYPPKRPVRLERIKASGVQMGAVDAGTLIRNLEDNKNYKLTKNIFVKYFNLEDEHNFKYIQNKDGTVTWRIHSKYVEPIKEELALYEPPLRYTPAPNIIKHEYDQKLTLRPEATFYAGLVNGAYMQDLFNDTKARKGLTNQYGAHLFTDWKLPVKAGAVVHYERSSYSLSSGGNVIYSALSFGPQFKTRDFDLFGHPVRFQTHFRVSPFARAQAETTQGNLEFEFNSADLLASLERPIANRWGDFVLGFFMQVQWLNLKNQPDNVTVNPSNEINRSFGLSFGQVFQ
jgi:hypothetical protein